MDIELALSITIPLCIISIIVICYFFTDKKDRSLYFALVSIFVLGFSLFFITNYGIQLLQLIGVIILLLYIIFSYIYPRLYSEQEEQFYYPRKKTIWESINQESSTNSTQDGAKPEKK